MVASTVAKCIIVEEFERRRRLGKLSEICNEDHERTDRSPYISGAASQQEMVSIDKLDAMSFCSHT